MDEFPVELESDVFLVVGSEPSFNLPLRRRFPDPSHNVFDPLLSTVLVEARLTPPNTPEYAPMIRQGLPGLAVFMDGSIEQPDHVLRGGFIEVFATGYEPAVVVEDGYEPSWRIKLQVTLP